MDAEAVRNYLAGIDWTREFDPGTLRRANAYLANDHLQSLTFERDRRGVNRELPFRHLDGPVADGREVFADEINRGTH